MAKKRRAADDGPCPITGVIEVFGGKWKSAILYHLDREGTLRFTQLKRLIPAVSQRMLTLQLRELERDGLVLREHYPEIPPRVEYTATPLATSLVPVFKAIEKWGDAHMKTVHKARAKHEQKNT